MQTGLHLSIHAFEPTAWDALNPSGYPGLLHGFLSALEDSKSVGEGTGWRPLYASVTENNELIGAMVCYLKSDSYGEYVFDWAWADAYHRQGLNYYPKCITAIPFTPASGPRILIRDSADQKEVTRLLIKTLKQELTGRVSSWHILFPDEESYQCLQTSDSWLERLGVQFHWFNQEFETFDDHLATFNSKRRKETRRERRRVAEQGIIFERLSGHDIDGDALDTLFQCYQMTYRIRGSLGYLTREFFEYAVERIPDAIRVAFAIHQGKRIAMSFCLRDQKTLYGRYWGALYDVDCLHFETCFHQWIEDAIEQGIERFDPGAQGEHKIARGFRPIKTRSLHWIENQEFGSAIEQFLIRERAHIEHYFQACDDHTPFKLSDEALRI
ncbi:MAG: GNAT family N-acetyltransferase [Gammaproteobacteria bacterium]